MDSLAVVDTFGFLMPSAVPSYVRRINLMSADWCGALLFFRGAKQRF
jgi:hypothetical protein